MFYMNPRYEYGESSEKNIHTTLTINDSVGGGKITGAWTSYGGGGLRFYGYANDWGGWIGSRNLTLAGKNIITGNTSGGKPSDLMIDHEYNKRDNLLSEWHVTTDGALFEGTDIGIMTCNWYDWDLQIRDFWPYVFTDGFKANNSKAPWAFFTSNNPDFIVLWSEDGKDGYLGKGLILSYDANGGEGSTLESRFALDETETAAGPAAENEFTLSGYEFTGWNTEADGSGTAYAAGDKVALTENMTLYAQWKEIPKPELELESEPEALVKDPLLVKLTAKGATSLVLTWTKVKDAKGYDIFFANCDKDAKLIKTVKAGKKLSWTKKGLKKGDSYRAYVRAYTMTGGKKKYIGTSLSVHAYANGGTKKYTNPKSVTVKKTSVKLAVGKTYKIKADVTKLQKGKKLIPKYHTAKLRYLSSNQNIAMVSKGGKVTAKAKGSCKVYVIAVNGVRKAMSITVK